MAASIGSESSPASPFDEPTGLNLANLSPMSRLVVRTRNSLYRITVFEPPSAVLLQGGKFFPERTEVRLSGCILGTSSLRTHWIRVGRRVELYGPTGRIVTSPVRSIQIERDSVHGPF